MNKKIQVILNILMISILALLFHNFNYVEARELSEQWVIASSEVIGSVDERETITLDNIVDSSSAISIGGNAEVEFVGIDFVVGNNVNISRIFDVSSSAKLTLTDVTITTGKTISYAVYNNGILKINKISCTGCTKTVYNNSSVTDSIQLYEVNNPLSISLNKGYVSVYENTSMSNLVTLDMGSNPMIDNNIGKVLVKGRNTFANYYENYFYLNGTPRPSNYQNAQEYMNYMQANTPYYMDYAGDVGDVFANQDDGYEVLNSESQVVGNLESGDLFFTKYCVYLNDSEDIYVAGLYATADKFVNNSYMSYTAIAKGISNKAIKGLSVKLNNHQSLVGDASKNYFISKTSGSSAISGNTTLTFKLFENETQVGTQTASVITGTSKAIFVNLGEYEYLSMASETVGVEVVSTVANAKFVRPIISCTDVTSGVVKIQVKSTAPQVNVVEVNIPQTTFDYSKNDIISSIKPYYMLNSNKVELDASEYVIKDSLGNISTSVINAGNYTIELQSNQQTIQFSNSSISFNILPIEITLQFDNSFTYDGNEKVVSALPIGVLQGDTININYNNNGLTLPGSKVVTVTIDNSNYVLAEESTSTTLFVDKATIDMSNVEFNSINASYDPNTYYEALATNVPNEVSVTYVNNIHKDVCTEFPYYYTATANFSLKNPDLYRLLITSKTTTITINKAQVDLSAISFNPINTTYTGNDVVVTVTGTIPEQIEKVIYTNNVQKIVSAEPYVARATFVLNSLYERNYELSTSYLETTITISKATIDFSSFVFEDTTIQYDGNSHQIFATGLDETVVDIEYLDTAKTIVGDYDQRIRLILLDENNYQELPENKKLISAKLYIIKATINMTGVNFEGTVEEEYSPNVTHNVQVSGQNLERFNITYRYYKNETLLNELPINAGTYKVYADFKMKGWDDSNYEAIPSKQVTLIITPIVIDVSHIEYHDITQDYTGQKVIAKITGVLPEELESQPSYINNIQTNASDTPYIATATFVLKREYVGGNYVVSPAYLQARITINRAQVDFTNFKYEDTEVVYDGNEHRVYAIGIDRKIVEVEYMNSAEKEVGSYIQTVNLTLKDTRNYEPLPLDKTSFSALLTIKPVQVSVNNISLNPKTVTYSKNTKQRVVVTGNIPNNLSISYRYYQGETLLTDLPIDAGVYTVYADFVVLGLEESQYEPIESKSTTLTIQKAKLIFTYTILEGRSVTYNGQYHSLEAKYLPDNITPIYENNNQRNVGKYTVNLIIGYDEDNYDLINYTPLSAILEITQAKINMSSVQFKSMTDEYDGNAKTVEITGTLPECVHINQYVDNSRIDAGTSTAIVSFIVTNDNYAPVDNMYATITITPKPITVRLKQNSFVYTGNSIAVEPIISGNLSVDNISVDLINHTNVNASVYFATIVGIKNSDNTPNFNYKIQSATSLRYEILKADVDMTGISYGNIEVVYDGKYHEPELIGTLPSGIRTNIIKPNIVNVGVYNVRCEFVSINPNYNTPQKLEATVTITPKPILVKFFDCENLMEDGSVKDIGVEFIGLIDNNFNGYSIEYSSTPIEAGIYECSVVLNENSNYEIINNSTIQFEIFTNVISFENNSYDMTIVGDGFSADTNVVVKDAKYEDIKLSLNGKQVKRYQAFEISVDDIKQEIEISMTLKTFKIDDVRYLKLYKVINGELKEIDFELNNNTIKFIANTHDQIVVMEELNNVSKNIIWTIIVIVGGFASFVGIIAIAVIDIVRKKKIKNELK